MKRVKRWDDVYDSLFFGEDLGYSNRVFEVIDLLSDENKRLQTENSILRVVLRNLTSELPSDEKKEIEKLIQ